MIIIRLPGGHCTVTGTYEPNTVDITGLVLQDKHKPDSQNMYLPNHLYKQKNNLHIFPVSYASITHNIYAKAYYTHNYPKETNEFKLSLFPLLNGASLTFVKVFLKTKQISANQRYYKLDK